MVAHPRDGPDDTSTSRPEPMKDPMPEKERNEPSIVLCVDLGAAEYTDSRPAMYLKISHPCQSTQTVGPATTEARLR